MTQAAIVLVVLTTLGLLAAMSLRANRPFKGERRLPMQWGLDGSVAWTAPRAVALAFTPVVAAISLAAVAALAIFVKPRAGQEDLVGPAVIAVALVFLGAHALHLWLIQRAVRRKA
ncbi:hypothetical protein [uncultured Caulobacter sp.]|uniref:hypothetical protein n=1 Tax=uncultured Caulobacter sp. TaxID=158749 RepID=UPI0026355E78|nr:hypothetical protein [uncultured Caulobacter sp.]